ncbi:putative FBD-associated F-box protein At1g61330 isoform X2 [Macadamia integrifolia]|uniref:putative FBD-associated F-box protein At1g61330 isoform X2 n=1 Tax=Macadamia integrifolia TaxID=60698 RepID=UPI001C4F7997|nr:putative FBD-associated F-box protein At1g61330 isoform X2 [Macadamia integrifolia]
MEEQRNPPKILEEEGKEESAMKKKSQNEISSLPDSILLHILSLLPVKYAAATSVLAKRWRDLSICNLIHAANLDFGDEVADNPAPEQFVDFVNRCVNIHVGKKIERFRLCFDPSDRFRSDAVNWIGFATRKNVKELHLDFCRRRDHYDIREETTSDEHKPFELPELLFTNESLTHLDLSHCVLTLPLDFSGFGFLKTLRLRDVNITETTLECLLANCPVLEKLILKECPLQSIKIPESNQQLRTLTLCHCWQGSEIEISAPNIRSFLYWGKLMQWFSIKNISALEEAVIYIREREDGRPDDVRIRILSDLAYVKILTICGGALPWHTPKDFRVTFNNLKELQLLADSVCDVYSFFRQSICPCLERFYIRLPGVPEDMCLWEYVGMPTVEPLNCVFNHLKLIKMGNFRGSKVELKMVKFLLERATVLESLVLVVPQESYAIKKDLGDESEDSEFQSNSIKTPPLCLLQEKLLQLPKASLGAQIILRESLEGCNDILLNR